VERAVFGTARIADTVQEGQTIIMVNGTVKAVELATGKILLTVNRTKRAQGSSGSAALSTAFKKLGEDLGQAIVNQLRQEPRRPSRPGGLRAVRGTRP